MTEAESKKLYDEIVEKACENIKQCTELRRKMDNLRELKEKISVLFSPKIRETVPNSVLKALLDLEAELQNVVQALTNEVLELEETHRLYQSKFTIEEILAIITYFNRHFELCKHGSPAVQDCWRALQKSDFIVDTIRGSDRTKIVLIGSKRAFRL